MKKSILIATMTAGALLSMTSKADDIIRIGYWTSGVSLGYGSVLEAKGFLAERGVEAEFMHFPSVNAPMQALASGSIDLAFGAPAAGVLNSASEGIPIKIFAATQPANVHFVVPEDSNIQSISEFRGKSIGMSPEGSSVAVIASAILEENYGISSNDFSLIGGNESRLVQFIAQEQVDAAALRAVTVEQLSDDLKVRKLGSFAEEWSKLTQSDAVPYIGVGAVSSNLVDNNPEIIANVISALRDTLEWGSNHQDEVAHILQENANLPAHDAQVYAGLWDEMYRISLEPEDIDTLTLQHQIFMDNGVIREEMPDDLFATRPYELATNQ
ncbi:ABC transporter substrate-binding protein [Billgrantia endophytica]|uniref:Nitrate ABC transporter substrate-binding protein n=1 Tax=Billgrantia endophytica TaxID=2033802 RepID=A0A2N7U6N5_9GAMM|nr:ABC transporter substrate-binding protein [Halomonas endophytica]PMR76106.1 nitrate ABC transporter substrate-binding protein [Halomonas endophytica]